MSMFSKGVQHGIQTVLTQFTGRMPGFATAKDLLARQTSIEASIKELHEAIVRLPLSDAALRHETHTEKPKKLEILSNELLIAGSLNKENEPPKKTSSKDAIPLVTRQITIPLATRQNAIPLVTRQNSGLVKGKNIASNSQDSSDSDCYVNFNLDLPKSIGKPGKCEFECILLFIRHKSVPMFSQLIAGGKIILFGQKQCAPILKRKPSIIHH